jgi:3-oxoacyl-[acyl-carrier-protein] synthase-1
MRKVFFGADNIITSLGFTTEENVQNMLADQTGIRILENPSLYPQPVPGSVIDDDLICHRFTDYDPANSSQFTRLEKLFILSIKDALQKSGVDPADLRTVFIISSTKGNIDLLESSKKDLFEPERVYLWRMGDVISRHFGNPNKPIFICNACVSGSVALITAARMIASGIYDHAVVTGGDVISGFVISGFMSFQALSPEPCKPFDARRTGLSLGEGCGTVVMTADRTKTGFEHPIAYLGGATSNDANHISGPSRDGEGLYLSIAAAMREAKVCPEDLGFISAHGTATPYNDEMESLALTWAGLENVPVNSFKGYIGHTLGAAGVIETILSLYSIRNNMLIRSFGYEENGVSRPLNVIASHGHQAFRKALKTASGFGGCNAAIVIGH